MLTKYEIIAKYDENRLKYLLGKAGTKMLSKWDEAFMKKLKAPAMKHENQNAPAKRMTGA
jgi:hypothetical protein